MYIKVVVLHIKPTVNPLFASPEANKPPRPPPLPFSNYSLLVNDRLYQSATTVKLRVD